MAALDIAVFLIVSAGLAVIEQGLTAAVRVWYARRNGDEVRQRVEILSREGRLDDALRVARNTPGSVSTVLLAGMGEAEESHAETAMKAAAARELDRVGVERRVLDWAGPIALFTPLALGAWLAYGGGTTRQLDAWLYLMSAGLGVAILAALGRFWLLARLRRLALDMEKGAAVVYNTTR